MSITNNLKERCWLADLHSDITRVKEEIRCEFARLRHTLNSREISLLDQVDSVKEASTSLLITQQLAVATVRSKMEECARYLRLSKEEGNETGVRCVANMMEDLKIQARESQSHQEVPFPQVKFARDGDHLRKAILSYGKLETDFDDVNSERSWDLVPEKDDCELMVSSERKGCRSTPCHKQAKEIEDMEFACISSDDDFEFENIDLSQVCKANELCTTRSECVCDSPCYSKQLKKKHSGKAKILSKPVVSHPCDERDKVRNFDHSVEIEQEDILHQISNSVEHLLSSPMSAPIDRPSSGRDNMDQLQLKLQGILDCPESRAFEHRAVESVNHSDAVDDSARKHCSTESTVIDDLHNKLQSIFNQTSHSVLGRNSLPQNGSDNLVTPSLICDLNARLQAIVNGAMDPDEEIMKPNKSTVMGAETLHHEMPSNDLSKDSLFNILHGKIHGILGNDIDHKEKMDDMSEIPELVKQDPIADLHMQIAGILEKDNSESFEKDDVSLHMNYGSPDPISLLSSRMQSLISG